MRKALLLSLFLALVGCADSSREDDSSPVSGIGDGEKSNPSATNGASGASESRAAADDVAIPVVSGGAASAGGAGVATGSSAGVGGGGFAGGVGGASAGGASAGSTSAGAAAPTGFVGVPAAAPSGGSGVTWGADAGTVAPIDPAQASLTAGAWDDNLNYERFRSFLDSVRAKRQSGILPFTSQELETAHQKFSGARSAHSKLDVALVVDTTGSMGDEIAYLQREFDALSSAIETAYPNAEQRWALVAYKDETDEYVTRYFDFRTDLEDFRQKLAGLRAGGGGDFPEAPDAALGVLNQFAWRTGDDVARLAFWVADAPHHDSHADAMAKGIRDAATLGVHVYPVASSGIDDFTELTMRTAAQVSGGRYLFLTNDSGIGGDHKEPSIPCYFVTTLKNAISRMVEIELSGKYREPQPSQVLRTGGNPQDGACKLSSGTLTVF